VQDSCPAAPGEPHDYDPDTGLCQRCEVIDVNEDSDEDGIEEIGWEVAELPDFREPSSSLSRTPVPHKMDPVARNPMAGWFSPASPTVPGGDTSISRVLPDEARGLAQAMVESWLSKALLASALDDDVDSEARPF
jgi:hypothetical protein